MGGTDETVSVRLEFESSVLGWLCCSSVTPFYFRLTTFGDKGWAEVRQFSNVDLAKSAFVDLRLKGEDIQRREYPMGDPILANLEAWADAALGKEPYPNTNRQMIHNIEILESIVLSAKESRVVDVCELPGQVIG